MTDEETGSAITDPERLSKIKELLCNVLRGNNKGRVAKTTVSTGATHTERRLHQMMFDDRDYQRSDEDAESGSQRPKVTVVNWFDKDYSVVTVRCKDRPKLLFDTVCTLTDMQYVVFHGNVVAERPEAYQVCYPLFSNTSLLVLSSLLQGTRFSCVMYSYYLREGVLH